MKAAGIVDARRKKIRGCDERSLTGRKLIKQAAAGQKQPDHMIGPLNRKC